jgi:hypothetical protein
LKKLKKQSIKFLIKTQHQKIKIEGKTKLTQKNRPKDVGLLA